MAGERRAYLQSGRKRRKKDISQWALRSRVHGMYFKIVMVRPGLVYQKGWVKQESLWIKKYITG